MGITKQDMLEQASKEQEECSECGSADVELCVHDGRLLCFNCRTDEDD